MPSAPGAPTVDSFMQPLSWQEWTNAHYLLPTMELSQTPQRIQPAVKADRTDDWSRHHKTCSHQDVHPDISSAEHLL